MWTLTNRALSCYLSIINLEPTVDKIIMEAFFYYVSQKLSLKVLYHTIGQNYILMRLLFQNLIKVGKGSKHARYCSIVYRSLLGLNAAQKICQSWVEKLISFSIRGNQRVWILTSKDFRAKIPLKMSNASNRANISRQIWF